jgi:hypothetical protein
VVPDGSEILVYKLNIFGRKGVQPKILVSYDSDTATTMSIS